MVLLKHIFVAVFAIAMVFSAFAAKIQTGDESPTPGKVHQYDDGHLTQERVRRSDDDKPQPEMVRQFAQMDMPMPPPPGIPSPPIPLRNVM